MCDQNMGAETKYRVAVTHFINPHLFWFRHVGLSENENTRVVFDLECKLQDLYRNKPQMGKQFRLTGGDKVAVNFLPWKKYIRAEVLQTAQSEQAEFIVWITDYGFPLLTKEEYLRWLPEDFQLPVSQVYCGGVANLQPAEVEYDHVVNNLIMVKQDQWLQKACELLQSSLVHAAVIFFHEKYNTTGNHRWGDLIIVNHKGNQCNASILLQSANCAMEVGPEFPQICHKYKTTKIAQWLTNNHRANIKYNLYKNNMMEQSKPTNSVIIDEYAKRKVDVLGMNPEDRDKSFNDQDHKIKDNSEFSYSHQHGNVSESKQFKQYEEEKCYINKAEAYRKLMKQKYASNHNRPQLPQLQAFDIKSNETVQETTCKVGMPPIQTATSVSSNSSTTNVSIRMQKLAELRAKCVRNNTNLQQHIVPLTDTQSNDSQVMTSEGDGDSNSVRVRKINEIRKKRVQRLPDMCEKNTRTDSTTSSDTLSTNQSGATEKDSNLDNTRATTEAFEGLPLLPAGFDIARLQNYTDEKNHWHRKQSSRFD